MKKQENMTHTYNLEDLRMINPFIQTTDITDIQKDRFVLITYFYDKECTEIAQKQLGKYAYLETYSLEDVPNELSSFSSQNKKKSYLYSLLDSMDIPIIHTEIVKNEDYAPEEYERLQKETQEDLISSYEEDGLNLF